MKNVLITGANSYIGESVREYLIQWPEQYAVTVRDTRGWNPTSSDFQGIDVVFNVAGIVHIKETVANTHLYFEINRDLVVKIAKRAKEAGVKQFILLSTMSVYGLISGHITKNTPINPISAYGESKAAADKEIGILADESFIFACLRPPMVYGKGCKGNYQSLRKFAIKSPIFPNYQNRRSMLYIGNLCEFVKECIDEQKGGLFFPQNVEYTNVCRMVEQIAQEHGKRIRLTKYFNIAIKFLPFRIFKKVFGDLTYEKVDLINRYSLKESITLTEQ